MCFANLRLEKLETVNADENVSVGVDFEQVAVVLVEPESPGGERGVVLELEELLGVTDGDEPLLQQSETQNLSGKGKPRKFEIHFAAKFYQVSSVLTSNSGDLYSASV